MGLRYILRCLKQLLLNCSAGSDMTAVRSNVGSDNHRSLTRERNASVFGNGLGPDLEWRAVGLSVQSQHGVVVCNSTRRKEAEIRGEILPDNAEPV